MARAVRPGFVCRATGFLAGVVLVTLATTARAFPIFVTNNTDTTSVFKTTVDAPTGMIVPSPIPLTLTDIPGTPWQSNSVITESAALLGGSDVLRIDWAMQHLQGPDAIDVNPGAGVIIPPLIFTAAVAGPFALALPAVGTIVVAHPTTGLAHEDSYILSLSGTVVSVPVFPFVTRLAITDYKVTYQGFHNLVPEPSTLALLAAGSLALVGHAALRRVRRTRRRAAG